MRLHATIAARLTAAEADALLGAVQIVDDQLMEEIAAGVSGDTDTKHFSDLWLPERYRDLYDVLMARRLYACLHVIAERLERHWQPPGCRGEELITRAILEMALNVHEQEHDDESEHLADLVEYLFEDLDHEYLFDPRFDGIDDPETFEGAAMHVAPLHPSHWFEPFGPDIVVHPMARRSGDA